MEVKSIFSVDGEHYSVTGCGQQTVGTVLKQFKGKKVFLIGFQINGNFYQPEF